MRSIPASVADLKFLYSRVKLSEELQIQSHTSKYWLANVPLIPKSALEVPHGMANFGIGTLEHKHPGARQMGRQE